MSIRLPRRLRRFLRREDGSMAVVEFAIMFPVVLTMFLSGVEMGIMTVRQTLLEHALNLAVRDLRIGTGAAVTHDSLRDRICGYAGMLPNCEDALRLELRATDLRNYTNTLSNEPDCLNRAEEINPVLAFSNGQRSELMLMRACFIFTPIFPNIGFGYNAKKDDAGDIRLYATTAFVNEPT
ncbi:TadE/TadG family type IV pilus assembly protein [Pseudooceanicola sp. LIPI14-2-Ac024]|uniref:TadE/TadG family type IV pilus assembly protein n=1 Tax=Pseudooceanicola sp. LIPI14-2-Ac024 TaxID=3344875 RepID=UPI0035CEE6CE